MAVRLRQVRRTVSRTAGAVMMFGISFGLFVFGGASINLAEAITGFYIDASSVNHGYLRHSNGAITTFDAPGAGTGPGPKLRVADCIADCVRFDHTSVS